MSQHELKALTVGGPLPKRGDSDLEKSDSADDVMGREGSRELEELHEQL